MKLPQLTHPKMQFTKAYVKPVSSLDRRTGFYQVAIESSMIVKIKQSDGSIYEREAKHIHLDKKGHAFNEEKDAILRAEKINNYIQSLGH